MNKTYINCNAKLKKQSGFTLLEVLVALALGVAILTATITMQIQHRKGFALTSNKLEMQTNAKFAFEFISQSLRSAGAMGCKNAKALAGGSTTLDNSCVGAVCLNLADPTIAYADFRPGQEVLGYQSLGTSLSPALSTTFPFVTNGDNNDNSDVLTVSGGYGEVYNVKPEYNIAVTDGGFELDLTGISQVRLINNQYGMLTSCKGAKIFQVVSTNAEIGAGTINWAGQLGTRSESVANGNEREFRRAAVVTYFVGQHPLGDTNGVPTLYQDVDGVSTRLIEGVEEIQLLYGYSDGASTDRNVANRYDTADNITDWSEVISVRVGLIMRSAQPVFETNQTQNISLACANGYTQSTKTDRFARSTYCADVTLRNRLTGTRVGEKVTI
ncbi:MAG: PilW family protein [Gammaproteobacteria bacterium]|nr:PilW family protein [Gammaproteobacteria bacterium]